MENMSLNQIRKMFLEFFESKGHLVEESAPLVPRNDKSLLLINAGMAPLKNYFSGAEVPPSVRMATCQKCIRTGDIENVGITSRHATMFEMLGNFSFGDYFKEESLVWGWEFVIDWLKLDADKVWPSVYHEDEDAYAIWRDVIKVPEDKIVRLGKSDNFWEIGTGPCGPCSELYYDRGEKYGCDSPDCKPGCECDRYMEFWNHVFTEFNRTEAGEYEKLDKQNIDTGMGLERMACIMQNVDSIYEIDTIKDILDEVCRVANYTYGTSEKQDISVRIITDHIRAVSFLVCDGVMPNNEGRGYVLRRLLRRAARHGKLLGVEGVFLRNLVDTVLKVSGDAYPDLLKRESYIKRVIELEEERFIQTIDQGLGMLVEFIDKMKEENGVELPGEIAFKLHDTFGFPLDLTKEILSEHEMFLNEDAFKAEMEKQRERARSARTGADVVGWKGDVFADLDVNVSSSFIGYDALEASAKILAIGNEEKMVKEAVEGDEIQVILDATTFYPEGGGQVGDTGVITSENFQFLVKDTKKGNNNTIIHVGKILSGLMHINDLVKCSVDSDSRMDIARNHTATHLLHKALREVIGTHVEQAGSQVDGMRLRFDFSHFQGLTKEEIDNIERIVNNKVFAPETVAIKNTSVEEAKEMGAMALFGEKYGDVVRVVKMGDFSTELCGGTHLNTTAEVGTFKIISETGVAAGVRRIEAITGRQVYNMLNRNMAMIHTISDAVKSNVTDLTSKIDMLVDENKKLVKEVDQMKSKMAAGSAGDLIETAIEVAGMKVIAKKIVGADIDMLKTLGDNLKEKCENTIIALATETDGKALFVVMATDDAVKNGAHSGKIVKELAAITKGGGGGKPNMAQAGGKDPSKIDEALENISSIVQKIV